MKKIIAKFIILQFVFILSICSAQPGKISVVRPFKITVSNRLQITRNEEVILLDISTLLKKHPNVDFAKCEIQENQKSIYFEIIADEQGKPASVAIQLSFNPGESKSLSFIPTDIPPQIEITKKTQAFIGVKTDYKLDTNYYNGGKFVSTNEVTVPKSHFAHDALYQYEGPGWESDKIAYRFYLDSRNRTDIFGKKTTAVVMHNVGKNDLVSNSKESYTKMQDWGMDIFKVGNSLGIGSLAYYIDGKVQTVSETDEIKVKIENNKNLYSSLVANYTGWKNSENKTDLKANISIMAGSRLTKVTCESKDLIEDFCTGLAKHEDSQYFESPLTRKGDWGYIGIFGEQALSGDNLGIAIFYPSKQLTKRQEDEASRLVILKPVKNCVSYYFAAAWQQEKNGIKTRAEFIKYLDETITKLSNPISINY